MRLVLEPERLNPNKWIVLSVSDDDTGRTRLDAVGCIEESCADEFTVKPNHCFDTGEFFVTDMQSALGILHLCEDRHRCHEHAEKLEGERNDRARNDECLRSRRT